MHEKEAASIFFAIITKPIPNKISGDSVKVKEGPLSCGYFGGARVNISK
jgi:hypothetical protein